MARMNRHLRSFARGATGSPVAGGEVLATPADVMAKATRMLKRVLWLQLAWFLCFVAGGVLILRTAWENAHRPAACSSGVRVSPSVLASCLRHHSYEWPVLLVLIGMAGLLVTGYVATRLAVRYLGAGAAAFLRGGRRFMGPMGRYPGGSGPDGGSPGSGGGAPPGIGPGSAPGTGPPGPPTGDGRF
jgi:hypothetical protein